MIPRRASGQSFQDHQREMAQWIGCTVDEMNEGHDPLHRALCDWLGIESEALKHAAGKPHNAEIAAIEEAAVLCLQRLMAHTGVALL